MNDDIRAAHQFRMPRHSSVTKSALTENQNPLLPDWFNKWKATASPSPAAKADNMPRIITKDLRLDAITATSDTASTAIIKKS
ncbi:MAG TPA: hypothetical protein VN306_12180, partial [Mycobacterium sp.]|nr:hypothetical protein [Mycobacterium sp.]